MAKTKVLAAALLLLFAAGNDPWLAQKQKFQKLLQLVQEKYPVPVDEKKLVRAAIEGLLDSLDPHSYFLDAYGLRSLVADQRGNFFGIGVRVRKFGSRLTVMELVKGLPAARAGIMPGDVIVEISGQKTAEMPYEKILGLLRGEKESEVEIKVQREGRREPIPFRLRRVFIPLESLTSAFLLQPSPAIGYASLRLFGSRSTGELQVALERLVRQDHIRGLILDLRDNPGGSLEGSVEIAGMFLAKGAKIVSVRGRRIDLTRRAVRRGAYVDLPLALLVNRGSASASEIVAAALQDNGRALIVGQRTYGKGVVETVNSLSFNCALALTTARFFSPAGRPLQRDFSVPEEYANFSYGRDYDQAQDIAGGVRPDLLVRPAVYSPILFAIISRGLLFEFSRRLGAGNPPITEDFQADEQMLVALRRFLAEKGMTLSADLWEKNRAELRTELERQVVSDRFSSAAGVKLFLRDDPVCRQALAALVAKLPPA